MFATSEAHAGCRYEADGRCEAEQRVLACSGREGACEDCVRKSFPTPSTAARLVGC
jgi:hypothetical protein